MPTAYVDVTSPNAAIILSSQSRFYVLLTNTSTKPLIFFEEWNSWGYYNLTFEITYSGGRKVELGKASRGWDKNAPATFTVAAGGYHVFEVNFGPEWGDAILKERLNANRNIPCRMRAIYTNTERGHAPFEEHVWMGSVDSEEKPYTIWP